MAEKKSLPDKPKTNQGGKTKFKEGNQAAYKAIDWRIVMNLAGIGCTKKEIAHTLGVSGATLSRRSLETFNEPFENVIEKGQSSFRASIRRMQFKSAMGEKRTVKRVTIKKNGDEIHEEFEEYLVKPSATMQVWLGKNYLEQTDKVQHSTVTDSDEELDWIVTFRPDADITVENLGEHKDVLVDDYEDAEIEEREEERAAEEEEE